MLPIIVAPSTSLGDRYHDLNASGQHVKIPLPAAAPNLLTLLKSRAAPFYLIAARETTLTSWAQNSGENYRAEELIGFPAGDCLLFVKPLETGQPPAPVTTLPLPPFCITPQSHAAALGFAPMVQWADLAVAPLRTKNGHSYLWCGPSGTLWVSLDQLAHADPQVAIKFRFSKGVDGELTISIPGQAAPQVLNANNRRFTTTLSSATLASGITHYRRKWLPIHFKFEGAQRHEAGFDYPKTYCIDQLTLFGRKIID